MASDCRGFHAGKCVDFMPANGNLPAGPRHHELPVGGIKSAELKRRKRIHDSPKHCQSVDKSRKKQKVKAEAGKDRTEAVCVVRKVNVNLQHFFVGPKVF